VATVAPPTTAGPAAGASGRRRPARPKASRRAWIGFTLPFIVPFVLFYLLPIGYAIAQSLTRTERTGGIFGTVTTRFAGLEQYGRVLSDPQFRNGIGRVLLFGVIQVPVMLGFALLLALLLDSTAARLNRFFRIAYFLPYGIPGVIAALMWAFLYSPQLSPIVKVLNSGGIAVDFLGSGTILWAIANVVTWTYTGYNMLIIFAALQAIPQSVYEAAKVDGSGAIRTAWSIKIPLVLPAIVLTAVFSIIGTLQLFTEPVVFRAISTNVTSSFTPNLLAYNTASANNYPLAAAMSVILALATFILSFTFLRATSKRAGL
jgi:multiple sugar transport system permease protein